MAHHKTWFASVLAGSILAAAPMTAGATEPAPSEIKKTIENVQTEVADVKNDVNNIKNTTLSIEQDIQAIQIDSAITKDDVRTVKQDVETAKQDLTAIKEDLQNRVQEANKTVPDAPFVPQDEIEYLFEWVYNPGYFGSNEYTVKVNSHTKTFKYNKALFFNNEMSEVVNKAATDKDKLDFQEQIEYGLTVIEAGLGITKDSGATTHQRVRKIHKELGNNNWKRDHIRFGILYAPYSSGSVYGVALHVYPAYRRFIPGRLDLARRASFFISVGNMTPYDTSKTVGTVAGAGIGFDLDMGVVMDIGYSFYNEGQAGNTQQKKELFLGVTLSSDFFRALFKN